MTGAKTAAIKNTPYGEYGGPGVLHLDGPIGSDATSGARQARGAQSWDRRQVVAIVVLCGALFLDASNTSSVNVALPTSGTDHSDRGRPRRRRRPRGVCLAKTTL